MGSVEEILTGFMGSTLLRAPYSALAALVATKAKPLAAAWRSGEPCPTFPTTSNYDLAGRMLYYNLTT
jgi:hypothetical protein